MASSQVGMAASSSPFGCVLRDHKRRERCSREAKARAATFQKNLKELVRDHLHPCISVSSDSSVSASASADENQINDNIDHCRIHNKQKNNINDSSSLNPKKARILDRWAAKQAREMVSSIERQSHEAHLFVAPPPPPPSSSSSSSSSLADNFGQRSRSPVQSQSLGASSLVQIWEARLNNNPNVLSGASKTNCASSYTENTSSSIEEPSTHSDEVNSRNITNKESLADWESSTASASSTVHHNSSDAVERQREKVRVADIIRRLTSDGSDHHKPGHCSGGDSPCNKERRSSFGSDHSEQRSTIKLVSSPKIRGRKAVHDLLMRMEQERRRELHSIAERQAVSKFSQRGRIQSMLRLQFLQRGMAIQDQQRPQSARPKTAAPDSNQSVQGSVIMQIRERFSLGVEHARARQSDADTPKRATELVNNNVNMSNSSNQSEPTDNCHHKETIFTSEQQSAPSKEYSVSQTSEVREEVPEEVRARLDATSQGTKTSVEPETLNRQGTSETAQFLNEWDGIEIEVEEEEADDYQPYFAESNYDWFRDIARPRSYWEGKRQEWYQKVLTTSSGSDEIRRLLERKTVSGFLASDFRGVMDQLILSRAQGQVGQEDDEFDDENNRVRMGELMSFFQTHLHTEGRSQEEEQEQQQQEDQEQELNEIRGREGEREAEVGEYPAEEEEKEVFALEEQKAGEDAEGSPTSTRQHLEATDYFDQSSQSTNSMVTFRSWNYSHHHGEVADQDSELLPTTPASRLYQASKPDSQQHSSSANRQPSIEMERIYDLRGHMKQLQREMFELTKSIQSCMETQRELQDSLKQQQVHNHTAREHGRNPLNNNRTPKNRLCCICYAMQVDSFLYRCGHMCTCLNCAHELKWSSGKCPICRAPIMDVVRAYTDS